MKFKPIMMIKAATALIVGIPMTVVPCKFLPIFGITLAPGGRFAARGYGAAMLGFLMLCWFARNAEKSDTRKAIIISLFTYNLLASLTALYTQLRGVMNGLGWLIVCIYLFFAAVFGYLLLREK
jgi:hypothetical protein